ncbi:MAG TPA: oxidoreductase [Planctomycetes bacterium]|nr:oxidoreductase [Planctomycetota bacterium]
MDRRSFLQVVGSAAGGLAAAAPAGRAAEAQPEFKLPRRMLGRTGQEVSVVGFPGLALIHGDQQAAGEGIRKAFERGVNYFDVAPAYGNGDAEIKMGIGLQGIDRSRIFLACKTNKRDKQGAREELERSLVRLKTDHFDLYQLHHLRTPAETAQALGPGGAMETLIEAKKEGKVKYLGFSAHTTKAALAAMRGFRFDTVMFPISFVEYFLLGFGKPVLELAGEQGAGVLAIKALSRGAWPEGAERTRKWWYRSMETPREIGLALRFVLAQKNVAAGIPPSFLDLLDKAVTAAESYTPITDEETAELRALAASCKSIFESEEKAVASYKPLRRTAPPDSPYEGCCGGAPLVG